MIHRFSHTALDRYPAKMVTHFADDLVTRFVSDDDSKVFDPFCGSGAILLAASKRGIKSTGWDINPYAVLLSKVKLQGFSIEKSRELLARTVDLAQSANQSLPIRWDNKDYWFTKATLEKYERYPFRCKAAETFWVPQRESCHSGHRP